MKRSLAQVLARLTDEHGIGAVVTALVRQRGKEAVTGALAEKERRRPAEMIPVGEHYRVWHVVELERRRRKFLSLPDADSERDICRRKFPNGYEYRYRNLELRFDPAQAIIPHGPPGPRAVGGRIKKRKAEDAKPWVSVLIAYNRAKHELQGNPELNRFMDQTVKREARLLEPEWRAGSDGGAALFRRART